LAGLVILFVIFVGGFSHFSAAEPTEAALKRFGASLRTSLPRCFSTPDLDTIAKELTGGGVRCVRFAIAFTLDDRIPWKLLCMAEEKFPVSGPLRMDPSMVVLTVEQGCVTRVTY